MKKFDIEDRLVAISVDTINLEDKLKAKYAGQQLSKQLIRSVSSSALNYAEAQYAESRKDFIHKLKIALKELRESHVCLNIINKSKLLKQTETETILKEMNELIAILITSVNTARKNSRD